MKEHGKNPQHQTNEEEIVYLKTIMMIHIMRENFLIYNMNSPITIRDIEFIVQTKKVSVVKD